MSRASVDYSMIKEELMKDQEFKEEYENWKFKTSLWANFGSY